MERLLDYDLRLVFVVIKIQQFTQHIHLNELIGHFIKYDTMQHI